MATEMREVIGRNLRVLREEHGLSQDRLADALRASKVTAWSQSKVAEIEQGIRHLRIEELLALMLYFRVPPEHLVGADRLKVRLGPDLVVSGGSIGDIFIDVKAQRRALPRSRSVEAADQAAARGAVPRLRRELEEWSAVGGDPRVLRQQRNRLAHGDLDPQQFGAWKRHELARLRREQDR